MTELTLLSCEAFSASTGGCWTIDYTSGAGDNGFLDCARAKTPGAASHASTAAAVSNLLSCVSAKTTGVKKWAHIVGHANDGLIVTGTGQSASDPLKFIAWWNQNKWQAELAKLKGRVELLRLWGCHPGTGQEGADLLYALMQVTGATCMGPTGFLYCNTASGFSLEAGSTWQVASPGQPKPNPISAPTPHFEMAYDKLLLGSDQQPVGLDEIDEVEVLNAAGNRILRLEAGHHRDVLQLVEFSRPMAVAGVPAALVTGKVILSVRGTKRSFTIYNNRLARDDSASENYYRVHESFAKVLNTLK